MSNTTSIVTLDLKNNKLSELNDEIFLLDKLTLLDLTNNDMQSLPPELGLMNNLHKILVEGNPLKSIRMAIRQGGTNQLKKYLVSRIDPNKPKLIPKARNQGYTEKMIEEAKQKIVQDAFSNQESEQDQWKRLVREFKNTNGDLDLRQKSLEYIHEDIQVANEVNTLDLSNNRIKELPPFLHRLNPKKLKIEQNLLREIEPSFVNFANLREVCLKGNKLSSFLENLNNTEIQTAKENFLSITYLDLSQNNFSSIPKNLILLENLGTLNLSLNSLDSFDLLFCREGTLEHLNTLNLSDNNINTIPIQIYKWQKLNTLNLANNNIRNFPPELGHSSISNLSYVGNPTMLIKNKSLQNTPALLEHLKDKMPAAHNAKLETEVASIREALFGKAIRKKQEIEINDDYIDPFKSRSNQLNDRLKSQFTYSPEMVQEEPQKNYTANDFNPYQQRAQPCYPKDTGFAYGMDQDYGRRVEPNKAPVYSPNNQPPAQVKSGYEAYQQRNDNEYEKQQIDDEINEIMRALDEDYSLNNSTKIKMRRELTNLRIKRNKLN